MSWYYNRDLGQVWQFTGVTAWSVDREIQLEIEAAKLGLPRIWYGPYATRAAADAARAANPSVVDQAKSTAQAAASDVTGAITQATNTAVKLTIRVAEAAAGIVLLAIAANVILKQATGVDVAGGAVKAGKTAAKVAAVA